MIELSIRKPVAVGVGVIFILLFGALSSLRVPKQLTPDVTKPQITVETTWLGATPHEIEREIIDEQEEQLKGVEGLERLTSESLDNLGRIILEFPPGTDVDSALIRVSNRLEQVPEYPADADKPVILTSNKTDNAMAWFMLYRLPGNTAEIDSYYRFADEFVKPRLERVPGVGAANIFGGREEELQVLIDPEALAVRGIPMADVFRAVDVENVNISAGDFTEGKRKYKVRTVGEYARPGDVEKVVLHARDGSRVYLGDVAEVRVGLKKRTNFVRQRGEPTIAINSVRRVGANVLETMALLQAEVERLNEGPLLAEQLQLVQVYDETDYIEESIQNVLQNLGIGSVLATAVLFLFLRSVASTFIVFVSIPISVIGSFILMYVFGRSINVVSLAGMSFAAGMVVDNSIVSLENIYRLRQEGRSAFQAALHGARQIWGAVLASTMTTIAVFVPVFFVEEQAAQLFRDIAIAISCAVGLSLVVSITVIPAMASKLLRSRGQTAPAAATGLFSRFREAVVTVVSVATGSTWLRVATVAGLTVLAVTLAWAFLPRAEYLPEGNRNLAIGILLPPPGYSVDELSRLGETIESRILPYVERREPAESSVAQAAARREEDAGAQAGGGPAAEEVRMHHFFFVAREASVFVGATASDPARAGELIPVMQKAVGDLPGLITVVQQASLFERGTATGRRVDIEITGPDLEELVALGGMVFGQVLGRFPAVEGHQARPIPSLDLQSPEVHVIPNRARTKDLGLDPFDIGRTVDAIVDGAKASEYMHQGREIDLSIVGNDPDWRWRTQDIANLPIYSPDGKLVTLGSVADVQVTVGPQQINHIERDRAITIQFVPSRDVPLEEAVEVIRDEIVGPMKTRGLIPPRYDIRLAGTADDLYQAFTAFRWNFVLAVCITYLLMAALFESYLYPLVILFSVPLAAVGGIVCLDLVHAFVPEVRLDVLTMLGFVILVGVVVNNAILIVYQALDRVREGMGRHEAVVGAVRTRIRPIFMTTMTSIFGMLPLVAFPGAGSELYRGLGSVVLGGLLVSTVFTLLLIPALLSLVLQAQERLGRLRRKEEEA